MLVVRFRNIWGFTVHCCITIVGFSSVLEGIAQIVENIQLSKSTTLKLQTIMM